MALPVQSLRDIDLGARFRIRQGLCERKLLVFLDFLKPGIDGTAVEDESAEAPGIFGFNDRSVVGRDADLAARGVQQIEVYADSKSLGIGLVLHQAGHVGEFASLGSAWSLDRESHHRHAVGRCGRSRCRWWRHAWWHRGSRCRCHLGWRRRCWRRCGSSCRGRWRGAGFGRWFRG